MLLFFFSSRRRHTRLQGDWSSDVCSSDLYDITWTAFCGDNPSEEMRKVFALVTGARDAGIERVQSAIAAGYPLCGSEVDDAVRAIIDAAGYGSYFPHRT